MIFEEPEYPRRGKLSSWELEEMIDSKSENPPPSYTHVKPDYSALEEVLSQNNEKNK